MPVTVGNPSPFAATPGPLASPASQPDEWRYAMTVWAQDCIANRAKAAYTEQWPGRWQMVGDKPGAFPISADCSGFVTGLARWAGAGDPNGLNFTGGFTGTLLSHCNHILISQARMGDLIVFGPGTGSHAVFIMERLPLNNFYCASFGDSQGPIRVTLSQMLAYFGQDSARYLRWLS